ncbi:MAG TPA: toxin-antitoxin system HicB family antitoxin [Verrucomicrobiae bacterium]|nr:toxin-antitoxin system HicB family antitoxin [Verrucomicrobiae bacterium]
MTQKEIKEKAARYAKFVEWSDEDRCFIGRCPELFSGGVHGTDEAKVYKELCETVEEWIEILHKDGELPKSPDPKDYSGKFVLRIEPALHRRLAAKALAAGESLNNFCARALANAKL